MWLSFYADAQSKSDSPWLGKVLKTNLKAHQKTLAHFARYVRAIS